MRKLFSADPTLGGTGIIAARISAHIRRSGTFLPGDWPLNTSINGPLAVSEASRISMADEPVSGEPVCGANSLLTGGILHKKSGRLAKLYPSERSRIS